MNNNLGQVVLVKDINPNGDSSEFNSEFTEFDGKLYFAANDGENGSKLYVTDGTAEGTSLVADINPRTIFNYSRNNSSSDYFTEFDGKLYFAANDGTLGSELYVTDGTAEGTSLVADINPGRRFNNSRNSFPDNFTEFNDKLYFSATGAGLIGSELYVTDGTSEGTQLVKDIYPDVTGYRITYSINSSSPNDFTEFNDKLYFSANSPDGRELFVTDGTTEGTKLVKDIFPGIFVRYRASAYSSSPSYITEFNGKLYFSANSPDGRELFVTDGTTEGTKLVKDIFSGNEYEIINYFGSSVPVTITLQNNSSPRYITKFNNKLYFTATDGESGSELFVTDGTAEGTRLFADINPGSGSSINPEDRPNFTEFNGKLYFTADDGTSGSELFVTDGTTEGTNLVKDINPGSGSSSVVIEATDFSDRTTSFYARPNFTEFNGKLYFTADDGTSGSELWVTDGTAEGTQLVADINPGSASSRPRDFTILNNELLFYANDGRVGQELFKLTFDGTVTQSLNPIAGTTNSDNLVGTDADDEIAGDRGNDGITGELGSDMLNGGAGNDVLDGGAGDDTLDGGEGTDTAVYQFSPTAVTVSLGEAEAGGTASDGFGSTDSLFNLENVIGSDGDDNLTGNSGNNSLTGRGGNDTLAGGEGDDFLTGGIGADVLSGGEGSDQFVYLNPNDGGDTITDFAVGMDKITVVSGVFGGGLSTGELSQNGFALGSAASTGEQRFVFDESSGELFFDRDGNGAATQQLIATLSGVSNLSAEDIMLL